MKSYEKDITDAKAREGFERHITLQPGESLILFRDSSFRNTGTSGLVVTSERLIQFEGKGVIQAAWSDVVDADYKDNFPKRFVVRLKTGKKHEFMLAGLSSADAETVVAAANSARGVESSVPEKPQEAEVKLATGVTEGPYRLYHGVQIERDVDMRNFLLTLLIGPLLVFAMWWAGGVNHPVAIIFRVSFWIGLIGFPVLIISELRDLLKKGPRKIVYGLNEGRIIKKVLRGENDPLWKAESAPPDLDAFGLGDKQWKLADIKLVFDPDKINLKLDAQRSWMGTTTPATEDSIPRSDFEDDEVFNRLLSDLRARAQ